MPSWCEQGQLDLFELYMLDGWLPCETLWSTSKIEKILTIFSVKFEGAIITVSAVLTCQQAHRTVHYTTNTNWHKNSTDQKNNYYDDGGDEKTANFSQALNFTYPWPRNFHCHSNVQLLTVSPKVKYNYQQNRCQEPRGHRPIPVTAKFCDITETINIAMSFKSSFVCWPANLWI